MISAACFLLGLMLGVCAGVLFAAMFNHRIADDRD